MLLVMPPADRSEALSPVAVKVCTRARGASNCLQADGFLAVATTRNSMAASCAAASAEHSPTTEAATTATHNGFRVSGIVFLRVYGDTTRQDERSTKTTSLRPYISMPSRTPW